MRRPSTPLARAARRYARATALVVAVGASAACAAHTPPATTAVPVAPAAGAPEPGEPIVADRLVFGRGIPGGGTVSDGEWDAFVREVVTPRFPGGLSVWRGEGQWRDHTGRVVREPSVVLEVFHAGRADADAALREIAAEYKRRFRQEAVLRVTTAASVRLLDE